MKTGFTLIELIAGSVAAAVLALTLGTITVYAYRSWTSMQKVAELERDGSLAMRTISRVVRGAQSNAVQTVGGGLIVSNVNAIAEHAFRLSGDRLTYSTNGVSVMNLVQSDASVFSCTPVENGRMTVVLTLRNEAANVMMSMSNVITLRN
jgi:prepilin-type N-terminal cleavage/methylation domain-containing protein